MSIDYHKDIAAPYTFVGGESENTVITKTNDNFTLGETEAQAIEDRFEDTFSTIVGEGLTSTPTLTYSALSLSVTTGIFTSIIGYEVSYAGGNFTCLANQTDASIYFCQDGTWSTTLPTTKSYFIFATYTTNGVGVTSITLSDTIAIPQYISISDTITSISVPESPGYVDYFVDHTTLATFKIHGFIKPLSDSDDYYISLPYDGLISDGSDTQNTPPHAITETGFYVRITRKTGYYYADDPACTLTYTRTGMV